MLRPGTFALTVLLAALSAIGPLTTDMYLPSLPDIARLLDASTAQAQLTISAYLVGFAVGQIFYGPLADRHGRKPVLLGAMALYCVASLACALSTSIEMLIAARALQALGGSGGIVLARAIVRDLYSGARAGRELSLIGAVMALAPVLAPLARRRAADRLRLALGLFHAGRRRIGRRRDRLAAAAGNAGQRAAEPVTPASMLKSYRVVARNPAYLAYLGLASTSFAGLFAWISGSSFVLQYLYGLTPFQFGVAFAVGSVGYMGGTTFAARLVMRHGIDRTLGVGAAAMAAGGLGMVMAVAFGLTSAAVAGVADGALSRRSRHGAAAVDRRRHDAVSGAGGRGLRAARLRAAERGGAVRGGGRCAAWVKRLAACRRGGGDGLRDAGAVDRDARGARASCRCSTSSWLRPNRLSSSQPSRLAPCAVGVLPAARMGAGGIGARPSVAAPAHCR